MNNKWFLSKDGKSLKILKEHVNTKSGNFKGICVSAVLAYFGIAPDKYKYTWSKKAGNNYHAILRRYGWAVRSRKTAFKAAKTMGQLRKLIRLYSKDCDSTCYMVGVKGHVLLLNSKGQTIVDTAPRKNDRRKVLRVTAVFK